jgi:hypothetical protein
MTDDPTVRANPDHAQATGSKSSTATPSASSPIGKGSHPRTEEESEDDGGEGHKGPRVDAGSSPVRSSGESCGSDTDCKADGSTKK